MKRGDRGCFLLSMVVEVVSGGSGGVLWRERLLLDAGLHVLYYVEVI